MPEFYHTVFRYFKTSLSPTSSSRLPYYLIICLGLLLYSRTIFFDFSYLDDNDLIVNNFSLLEAPGNLTEAFHTDPFFSYHHTYYRPLLAISFMIDSFFMTDTPVPGFYHFTNIIYHLIAASLVYLVLTRLKYSKPLSLFFTLIFVSHPALTQAVAWIPGRNDPLLAIYVLLSFLMFINYLETKRVKFIVLHSIFFFLALLAKENAVILPIICLGYAYLIAKVKIHFSFRFLFKKPIFLTLLAWLSGPLIWFILRQNAHITRRPLDIVNLVTTGLEFKTLLLFQILGKFFLPIHLSVYPYVPDHHLYYGIFFFITILLLLILSHSRRPAYIAFGLLWFTLFLLPTFILNYPHFLYHRGYVPFIGLFFILAEINWIKRINFRHLPTFFISLSLLFFLSLTTVLHISNFRNWQSFWQNALDTAPKSPYTHAELGAVYYQLEHYDQAENEYKKAIELNLQDSAARNNLGVIYLKKRLFDQAESEFTQNIASYPDLPDTYFNLGMTYYKQLKIDKAETAWLKTIEKDPDFLIAYKNLIKLYLLRGDQKTANYYQAELDKRSVRQ